MAACLWGSRNVEIVELGNSHAVAAPLASALRSEFRHSLGEEEGSRIRVHSSSVRWLHEVNKSEKVVLVLVPPWDVLGSEAASSAAELAERSIERFKILNPSPEDAKEKNSKKKKNRPIPKKKLPEWMPTRVLFGTFAPGGEGRSDKLLNVVRQMALRSYVPLLDFATAMTTNHWERIGQSGPRSKWELSPHGLSLAATIARGALLQHCRRTRRRAPPAAESAAVCLSGWVGVKVVDGGAPISKMLLAPLGAEALLALTKKPSDDCSQAARCVGARMPHLKPVGAVSLTQMFSLSSLVTEMESLPHWPRVMKAYNSAIQNQDAHHPVSCTRSLAWSPALNRTPYKCQNIYLGNTVFAPVLGSDRLNVLRQLHDISRCLRLAVSREADTGRRFTRLVHSRLEFHWLRPHPPLSMLDSDSAWLPGGEDYYGGVNDRHAVLSREAAGLYMRRWEYLMDGSIFWIDPQLRNGKVTNGLTLQDENLVRRVLEYFHIPINRFPSVAFLACCPPGSACFSRVCVYRTMPRFGANLSHATPGFRGKYPPEIEAAMGHALALDIPGARYSVAGKVADIAVVAPAARAGEFCSAWRKLKKRATAASPSSSIVWLDKNGGNAYGVCGQQRPQTAV